MDMTRTLTALLLLAACTEERARSASALTGPSGWTIHVIADYRLGSDGAVYVDDLDDNGTPGLLGAWESDGRISAHVMPTQHVDLTWPSAYFGALANAEGVQAADLDGDGRVDAVGAQQVPGSVQLFFQPADSLAGDWPTVTLPQTGAERWLDTTLLDVDGDGDLDVIGRPATRFVLLWTNPGVALVRTQSAWALPTLLFEAKWVMSLDPLDVDGDGDLDLVVSQRSTSAGITERGLWWAEAGASWARHDILTGAGGGMIACVGDLDGDTDVDIVWPSEQPAGLRWFEATGGGSFVAHSIALPFTVTADAHPKGCAIGDVDSDGDMDVALTSYKIAPDLWVLDNDGSEAFTWIPILPTSWATKLDAPLILDVDIDGCPDIIGSEENQGRGLFWARNPGGCP